MADHRCALSEARINCATTLIVSPERVIPNWRPQLFSELRREDFSVLIELAPEIVVIGTGAKQQMPSPALYSTIAAQKIGLEIMATAAACRTYNILVSEGRRVAAGLLMI